MKKIEAIKLMNKNLASIISSNTIFSNITVQQRWWLQPHNSKFKNKLYIILNDDRTCKLYAFELPANTITNAALHFKQRNDRYRTNCSDIYIPISGTKFSEQNGFDFTQFLVKKIDY